MKVQNSKLFALIMAGGKGTRFWPESTGLKPKQYLKLTGDRSLLEETLYRFDGLVAAKDRFIITVKDQAVLAQSNSTNLINPNGLFFEPSGRNTAPCILLSLVQLIKNGAKPDDVVAIVPSDHVILNQSGFKETVYDAYRTALDHEMIVTIGIPPYFPHTGFGYIQKDFEIKSNIFKVKAFKEKPEFEVARDYVTSGQYFWNAGMFVAKIKTLCEEFEKHSPETFAFYKDLENSIDDFDRLTEVYNKIPKDSIDYAIMEKSNRVAVVPARFDWNDLGSWDALEAVMEKKDDNVIASAKGHYFESSKGNIIYAPDKFVSLIHVNDMIVVCNQKSLMVLPKEKSQKVKNVVSFLENHELGKDLI